MVVIVVIAVLTALVVFAVVVVGDAEVVAVVVFNTKVFLDKALPKKELLSLHGWCRDFFFCYSRKL
ncbi:hypothetical protein [Lederbergia citrea]|uniref:hypothetical protein n=1 Tax=Lederbergia citrea TaxID=2833581 RepID=UPI001BC93F56|nr:hypothetical protein [Lederbergia citrea]MBS4176532.1 hypothetical protein [Lederbergia citrea]